MDWEGRDAGLMPGMPTGFATKRGEGRPHFAAFGFPFVCIAWLRRLLPQGHI